MHFETDSDFDFVAFETETDTDSDSGVFETDFDSDSDSGVFETKMIVRMDQIVIRVVDR